MPLQSKKVVLIGWASADWKVALPLLEAGLMPSLETIVNQGVMGDLAALEPTLSPMLWVSAATGKRPEKHGVLSVLDVTNRSRKAKAIWKILSDQGLKAVAVGWPASHPAEPVNGAVISDMFWPGDIPSGDFLSLFPGTINPAHLTEPLAELRVHPAELTGAHLLPFVPRAATIDQKTDRRLSVVAALLAECSSIHAAATWLMEHEPWDFLAVNHQAIDRFSRAFIEYHPPRMQQVPERDFETYQHVIAGAYRFHDMMLGRILELAGPDSTVIVFSDHGFHSGHLRPTAAPPLDSEAALRWHRHYGMFSMSGPNVRKDERIYGASLLDIAPTVLTLFGLPVADDLDGRPLLQAFEDPPPVERIGSFENGDVVEPPDADRMMESNEAAHLAARDRKYKLARVLLEARKAAQAAEILEELIRKCPGDARFTISLALARFALGDLGECRRLLDLLASDESSSFVDFLMGLVCAAEHRVDEALERLLKAQRSAPHIPQLHCEIGKVYLRLERWEDAEGAFRQELDVDEGSAPAHDGLTVACLRQGRPEEAAAEAFRAVALLHDFPDAHFHLGQALLLLGRPVRAAQAFETCLSLRPETPEAHLELAAIHEKFTRDAVKAAEHRRIARELVQH